MAAAEVLEALQSVSSNIVMYHLLLALLPCPSYKLWPGRLVPLSRHVVHLKAVWSMSTA